MKAVAVLPGQPNSVHQRDIPEPRLLDQPHPHVCRIPEGRGVLVKVLQVGVDATDREINEALYGNAPPCGDHLVIGHECFGRVIEVGDKVTLSHARSGAPGIRSSTGSAATTSRAKKFITSAESTSATAS